MRRHLIGLAAALALGVTPAVAVATPALASSVVCTAFGTGWCLSASSLAAGTPITNGSGRDIIFQPQFMIGGIEVYQLVFARDTSKCVGFSSTGNAEVRDCRGNSNFTNWDNVHQGIGITEWDNHSFGAEMCSIGGSGDMGDTLTSDNKSGSQLYCSLGNRSGELTKFYPAPSP